MEHPRVLWAAPADRRPAVIHQWTLHEASTTAEALEVVRRFEGTDVELDAAVAAPDLPDGDGARVLVAVRERWSEAACLLHGDLWAVPTGSELPVCEFHPESQSVAEVVGAVAEAVRRRSHRPYPVHADEPRRLEVVGGSTPRRPAPPSTRSSPGPPTDWTSTGRCWASSRTGRSGSRRRRATRRSRPSVAVTRPARTRSAIPGRRSSTTRRCRTPPTVSPPGV